MSEYIEGYNLKYLTSFARRQHLGGWDAHKTLEETKNINFPISEYLLHEISDMEAKESYPSDDPAPSVSENPSTST